jgi:very-short-patch-repair endonuclease
MKRNFQPSMFYGAKPSVFEKAKAFREEMTESEIKLWGLLRKNKVMGFRFRPQHPIDRFIADFYCHSLKLIIEVDGGIHNLPENREYDLDRTFELEKFEIKVIRFTNDQILNDFNGVKKEIISCCAQRKAEMSE